MSYFIGCDIAKSKIDVSIVDSNGIECWVSKITNESETIAAFLLSATEGYLDDTATIVVESTGVYHLPLAETAVLLGIPCIIFNPIITKQQTKATIRGKKTDRTDATMIARLGLRGEGRLYMPEPYKVAKYHVRSAQKLSVLASSFKRHHSHMAALLGDDLGSDARVAMLAIQTSINNAKQQLKLDTTTSCIGDIFTNLQTIIGVGPYVAASIMSEVQDMTRFKTTKALTAYAGLDPKIRQSGKTLNSTGRLTKRGSAYLRRSIFIAASVARQHDPNLKALYEKKRSEGKSYTVAVCVVARKLLAIVRAVWLSGKPYDVDFATKG